MEVHWFLPTRGDSRDVGPATTDRGHNAAAAALGLDEFVLSCHPHLEKSWRVGEEVLPLLGRELAPA